MRKKALIGAAIIAVLAVGGPVGPASAAIQKVSLKLTEELSPNPTVKGTFSGKPFGNGSLISKGQMGTYTLTLKARGGTVTISLTGGPGANNTIAGAWKFTKGTGKYRRISGKGTMTGTMNGHLNLKGSAKY